MVIRCKRILGEALENLPVVAFVVQVEFGMLWARLG